MTDREEGLGGQWVSFNDFQLDWIGEPLDVSDVTVVRWIARAERMLRKEYPDIGERIISGREPDLLEIVKDVVISMVTRVLRNPAGHRQVSETTGVFTGSVTFAGANPGGLYLTLEERDLLRGPDKARKGQAYSLPMTGVNGITHGQVCSLNLGGIYCSCGAVYAGKPVWETGG